MDRNQTRKTNYLHRNLLWTTREYSNRGGGPRNISNQNPNQQNETKRRDNPNRWLQCKDKNQQNESRNGQLLQELITGTNLIPISLKADRGIWTRVNRNNPNEKSIIDYILVDSKTAEEVEEIIVDQIGTHRLRGKRESDHNTILMTLKQKIQPITEKKKIIEKRNPTTNSSNNNTKTRTPPTKWDNKKNLEETIGAKTITIGSHKIKEPPKTN